MKSCRSPWRWWSTTAPASPRRWRNCARGHLDTLALLKPVDQVAIFSFGEKPEMVEGLTSDHEALSVDLWALSPYGGTDIDGALYDAALYLGRTAPESRRAVILVSDNEPSDGTDPRCAPGGARGPAIGNADLQHQGGVSATLADVLPDPSPNHASRMWRRSATRPAAK